MLDFPSISIAMFPYPLPKGGTARHRRAAQRKRIQAKRKMERTFRKLRALAKALPPIDMSFFKTTLGLPWIDTEQNPFFKIEMIKQREPAVGVQIRSLCFPSSFCFKPEIA